MPTVPEHVIYSIVFAYFIRDYRFDIKHIAMFAFAGAIIDIDAILSLIIYGDLWAAHGSWFHSPFTVVIMGLVWAYAWSRLARIRFVSCYLVMVAGGLFHLFLDSFYYENSKCMWFLPFTTETFSWHDLMNFRVEGGVGVFTPFFMIAVMLIGGIALMMMYSTQLEKNTRRR